MFYLWADPTAASAATSYRNVCPDVDSCILVLRRWRPDSQCDAMPRQNASRSQDVAGTRGHSACWNVVSSEESRHNMKTDRARKPREPRSRPRVTRTATDCSAATSEDIARRAYELFEQRGGAHGQDWEDWLSAERELRSAN